MLTRKHLPIALVISAMSLTAQASSHREAPFIAQNPSVDGTDFYMFNSYETGRAGFVTLLANYNPLQDSYGGPNYFALNPNALYEIHIDNNGDALEDLTFQFRFTNTFSGLTVPVGTVGGAATSLSIPLVNIGPTTAANPTANLNRTESYTVALVRGLRRSGASQPVSNATGGATTFTKPSDNIGNKSFPDYAAYANAYIYNVSIPGCTTSAATQGRMFVGQRKEGFAVNLGEVFDLVNLNPLGGRNVKGSATADKNITTIALEVPASCLVAANSTIVGGWTTSSLRQGRVLNPAPQGPARTASTVPPEVVGGAWTQVSRLGSPLVNEVVIGIADKDRFNSSEPVNDRTNFANYVTNPTLPVLLNALFGAAANVPATPRNDLVAAFLTGVANVNQPAGVVPAEMLRLNTAIPATPAASQVNVGAALCFTNDGALLLTNPGCDPAGFPNGRRPGDDIVDIELSVVEGFLLGASNPNRNAAGQYQVYTDGALQDVSQFDTTFPYLKTPLAGSPNGPNGTTNPPAP